MQPNTPVVYHGNCLDVLRCLPANSIDSVVCDPPYHLTSVVKRFGGENAAPAKFGTDGAFSRASVGFMGVRWDGGDIAFRSETWAEVGRVLKPGGHLAAFGASRGYHRMACAIEDAGFEIRDSLMWVYGSGFPKSHDVSKGIDKAGGDALAWKAFSEAYSAAVAASELNHSDIDRALGVKSSSCYWARTDHRGGMPPWHHWELVRSLLHLPAEFERLYEAAERETVGHLDRGLKPGANRVYGEYSGDTRVTAPATDAAREWQGWGTALKPAFEPIVLARKPLSEGTVAANVLKWRTGALNIDGCRVGIETRTYAPKGTSRNAAMVRVPEHREGQAGDEVTVQGRWPANVVHSGEPEVIEAFPNEAHRFFFNTAESDAQWLARNLPSGRANDAPECFSLQSELAVFALSNAVAQSMPQLALHCIVSPAPSMNVTPSELRQISALLIETIQNLEKRCSRESLPVRHSLSDNRVSIAAACEQIDTITITISPSKSNGSVAPATFSITRQNSEVGAKVSAPSSARFHYSAKASKADRAGSKHPTVKPVALMQWLCRLITPPGGLVLDPFAGSGTTGAAAIAEGFRAVLIEREDEYVADILRRFAA